jgi:hypothetical protein
MSLSYPIGFEVFSQRPFRWLAVRAVTYFAVGVLTAGAVLLSAAVYSRFVEPAEPASKSQDRVPLETFKEFIPIPKAPLSKNNLIADSCDSAKLAEIVEAAGVSSDGTQGAIEVVSYYAMNACALGRQDVVMVRGMMSDAYIVAKDDDDRRAALMAGKILGDAAGEGCPDKDPAALLVLDQCSLEDVERALSGGK